MPGWAYFVNNGPYSDFIKGYVDQDEVCCHFIYTLPSYLSSMIDQDVRWFPSHSKHAHEEIEGSPRDWPSCGELCATPTLPSSRYG
jgi:hypothetical protein